MARPAAGRHRFVERVGTAPLRGCQRAGQLDHRQRVAACQVGQPLGDGPLQRCRRQRQLGRVVLVERLQLDGIEALAVEGAVARPHRCEHRHGLGMQPACDEGDHLGGRPVEPVRIVDRDQDGRALRRCGHQPERGNAHGQRLRADGRPQRERALEGGALHVGQGGDIAGDWAQQVGQGGERELALRFEAARAQHRHAAGRGRRVLEQCALADARLTDHGGRRASALPGRCQRRFDTCAFRCPPQ